MDEPDPLVEYKQATYKLMKEEILVVYTEFNKCIEEFGNAIRERNKSNLEEMDCLTNEICNTLICIKELLEHGQNTPLLSVKSSELKEVELTTFQTEHSDPLHSINLINNSIQVTDNENDPNWPVKDKPYFVVRSFSVMTINAHADFDFSSTKEHDTKRNPNESRRHESTNACHIRKEHPTIDNPKISNPYNKNKLGKLIAGNRRKKK
jgi:hypothetical protein